MVRRKYYRYGTFHELKVISNIRHGVRNVDSVSMAHSMDLNNVMRNIISLNILLLILVFSSGCPRKEALKPKEDHGPLNRIVSLTPAITETIYALGGEDRLVAVSPLCKYPPRAQEKPKVSGQYSPNLESLLALNPECIFMSRGNSSLEEKFINAGLHVKTFPEKKLEDVFISTLELGKLLNRQSEASALVKQLKKRLNELQLRGSSVENRPRVLMVVARNYHSAGLEDLYITGRDGFCDEILRAAGGENAYTGHSAFPKISVESVLGLNPDIIIETVPSSQLKNIPEDQIIRSWRSLPKLKAVQDDNIFLIGDDMPLLPAPSCVDWAEHVAEKLHACTGLNTENRSGK